MFIKKISYSENWSIAYISVTRKPWQQKMLQHLLQHRVYGSTQSTLKTAVFFQTAFEIIFQTFGVCFHDQKLLTASNISNSGDRMKTRDKIRMHQHTPNHLGTYTQKTKCRPSATIISVPLPFFRLAHIQKPGGEAPRRSGGVPQERERDRDI